MEILVSVLLLLVLLLITNIISNYVTFLPTALIQIFSGIVFALIVKDFTIEVETEWFLLLFIAPLLYNDGAHFPREQLWKMRGPILGNAIILVLLTTILGGLFVHWMIPMIPLAAAFALAAILSPTDPVAVNGIAKRIHIPERIMNLVRGESLINDASGLVAFNYAVVAVVTGYFSVQQAMSDFIYMFVVGAILGITLGLGVNALRYTLRRRGIDDVVFHTLLQILAPFIIFFIAEEVFHASGVIAVVAAGIVHTLVKEKTSTIVAQEQVLTDNLWSIIAYVLNGVIFLLLGLALPTATRSLFENEQISNWLLLGYVIALGVVVLVIRFLWMMAFNYADCYILKNEEAEKPTVKNGLISSLVGVRGTITMVGVLSIPLVTASNELFPSRSMLTFLAAGVILFTLIVATIFLPILSKNEDGEKHTEFDLNEQKQRMLIKAIKKIKKERTDENSSVVHELLNEYMVMLRMLQSKNRNEEELLLYNDQLMVERLRALKLERQYMQEFANSNPIPALVMKDIEKSIMEREKVVMTGSRRVIRLKLKQVSKNWKRSRLKVDVLAVIELSEKAILKYTFEKVINNFESHLATSDNREVLHNVIYYYKRLLYKRKLVEDIEVNQMILDEQKEILCLSAIEVQRKEITVMFQDGDISSDEAKELRRFVNYMESVVLYEYVE